MAVRVKDTTTPEGKKLKKLINELVSKEVRVGFQAGQGNEENGADIIDVAAYNEFGTVDIPSRPFLKRSFDGNEELIISFMAQEGAKTIKKGQAAAQTLRKIGLFQTGLIQKEITEGNFAPNAPSTVRRKGSSHPLIDQGTMRDSVRHVIVGKGGGE